VFLPDAAVEAEPLPVLPIRILRRANACVVRSAFVRSRRYPRRGEIGLEAIPNADALPTPRNHLAPVKGQRAAEMRSH
jgi:hypothetical protein